MKRYFTGILTAALMLTSVCTPAASAYQAAADSDYTYEVKADGTVRILHYNGTEKELTVPSVLDDLSVTEISSGTYSECPAEIITVPDCISTIRSYAFAYAPNLRELYLPDGLTVIEAELCTECPALETVIIPESVTTCGEAAFRQCTVLRTVNIPASLTYIPDNMFMGCSSLQTVALPETITQIGRNAFRGCTSLTNLILPEQLTTMESGAFAQCMSLTEITIPPQLHELEDHIFAQCSALTAAVIPESVTSINKYAFQNVPGLTVYGVSGSAAETFAMQEGIPFAPLSELPQTRPVWDFNGDGFFNIPDAVLLAKYLTEDDSLTNDTAAAFPAADADIDTDGILTVHDLVTLITALITVPDAL